MTALAPPAVAADGGGVDRAAAGTGGGSDGPSGPPQRDETSQGGEPPKGRATAAAAHWVAASPSSQAVSLLLTTLSASILAFITILVVLSPIQHATAQASLFDEFRLSLAEGSVPVGPVTNDGELVEPGTPVALLQLPGTQADGEVIVQGTAGAQTMQGIGHRRDTPMPCQPGTSVLMARATSYGGTGAAWSRLTPGAEISITTGQGVCTYVVTGSRRAGDPAPAAPTAGEGALVLTTALGLPYMPEGVLRIDAELSQTPFEASASALPSAALPDAERALAVDDSPGVLFGLILLLELLIAVVVAVTFAWRRWSVWQTWVFSIPVLASVSVLVANTVIQLLLPNLL